jgi:hypothetical protein
LACLQLPHRVKNHAVLNREQPVWSNEARVRELSSFEIGLVEGNGKVVGPMSCGDLTEDEIVAREIDEDQCGSPLADRKVSLRKRNDDDFA